MSGHTVSVAASERRVRVSIRGEVVAESERALELHETGYPTRYYLPLEDVRDGVLEPSSKTTHCPFKGDASYYSARVGGELREDVVWAYCDPIPAVAEIAGYVSFYPEKAVLDVF
jgi:uncharacterized protein (DUF427 family)